LRSLPEDDRVPGPLASPPPRKQRRSCRVKTMAFQDDLEKTCKRSTRKEGVGECGQPRAARGAASSVKNYAKKHPRRTWDGRLDCGLQGDYFGSEQSVTLSHH
ncbi:unnamed protein product, partial [Symbiodinium sp. CCMP2592]